MSTDPTCTTGTATAKIEIFSLFHHFALVHSTVHVTYYPRRPGNVRPVKIPCNVVKLW